MKKCEVCALRNCKPCYECSTCMGGDDHFRPDPDKGKSESNEKQEAQKMVVKFCPACGRLTDYDQYYGRYFCTACDWRSEKEAR